MSIEKPPDANDAASGGFFGLAPRHAALCRVMSIPGHWPGALLVYYFADRLRGKAVFFGQINNTCLAEKFLPYFFITLFIKYSCPRTMPPLFTFLAAWNIQDLTGSIFLHFLQQFIRQDI